MNGNWLNRNAELLMSSMRVIFGGVWLIDGTLKFQPGMTAVFPQLVQAAGNGQPAWLMPWFNFWAVTVTQNTSIFIGLVGCGELLLGIGLIFGGMRKITYLMGIFMSLILWSVPEGFGGPYGIGSTDIGTGIIYAFVFILLILINARDGPSKLSADYYIEKKVKWWKRIAEFGA